MHQFKVFHLKLNYKVGLAVVNQSLVSCKKEVIYILDQYERYLT